MAFSPFSEILSFATHGLAPWNPSMCDGCSVPSWIRWGFPSETDAQRAACCRHDKDYYYGGTEADRRIADGVLYAGLLRAGFSRPRAYLYWLAVRVFGDPAWRKQNPRAWGWGGGRYRYDAS